MKTIPVQLWIFSPLGGGGGGVGGGRGQGGISILKLGPGMGGGGLYQFTSFNQYQIWIAIGEIFISFQFISDSQEKSVLILVHTEYHSNYHTIAEKVNISTLFVWIRSESQF